MHQIGVVGLSYRHTPVEEVARFAVPRAEVPSPLPALRSLLKASELLDVGTCNRVEVLYSTDDGTPADDSPTTSFLNQGLCFWIRARAIPGAALSDHLLISIIDDDQPFRESMRRLMRSLGYTVALFSSAADFLASPRLRETSCLITDVHMPARMGVELFRHLITAGHTIPTILFTAYPSEGERVRALSEGVLCYLRKPVDEQNLSRCPVRFARFRPVASIMDRQMTSPIPTPLIFVV